MSQALYERVKNSFDKQAFLRLIGAKLEAVSKGTVTISCGWRHDLTQQQGFLHGGVVAALADVACGYTAMTVMPEKWEVLTVE